MYMAWHGLFINKFLGHLTTLLNVKYMFHHDKISEKYTGKDQQRISHEMKVLSQHLQE
jgi:hypothetical protein